MRLSRAKPSPTREHRRTSAGHGRGVVGANALGSTRNPGRGDPRGDQGLGGRASGRSHVVPRLGRRPIEPLVGVPHGSGRPPRRVFGPRRRAPHRLALPVRRADQPFQHHLRRLHRDVRGDVRPSGPGRSPAFRLSRLPPSSSSTSRASTSVTQVTAAGFKPTCTECSSRSCWPSR